MNQKYQLITQIAVLLSDFYKQCHAEQYDDRITKLVAYYTPRMSRLEGINFVPTVGIQALIKEYIIDYFNKYFFELSLEEVLSTYEDVISQTMGEDRVHSDKIVDLHKLGYLPIEIRALDEGTLCPIKCPMIEISNTHDDFAWVTNLIESLMSAELWYQGCTATAGIMYRKIVNEYYEQTSDNLHLRKSAISEFGMRGLPGLDACHKASMGFLMSFNKTATISSIIYLHNMYGDELRNIATGMASTEHSVMCSSYSLDSNEETQIKRLLTEIYPSGNFSMVCDSYDYWNVIYTILPKLKEQILSRKGTLYVRGDSGDPVEIVTKTVFALWNIFGGTENSKGYRVLDSHIRAIYGDSITPRRAEQIYKILEENEFSAENVALGAGSFSMLCLEEEYDEKEYTGFLNKSIYKRKTRLQPFTRDTFGVAIKTTYGETNGKSFNIFKNPKTDSGFKKSQKGCCVVIKKNNGTLEYLDEMEFETRNEHFNLLTPVFKDGKLLKEQTFTEIRNKLWNNDF